jgi:hypothetical protein
MNASRQIRCRRIIHAVYRGAIIKRLECDLAVGSCIATVLQTVKGDIRDKEVEIMCGGTGNDSGVLLLRRRTRYICELR